MRPRVIMHNSISVDGAVAGFDVDMATHYQLLASYGAGVHLVGSRTARAGVEVSESEGGEAEQEADRVPPTGRDDAPLWVVVDSGGALEGMLHHYRRFEYCREVAVLIAEATPASYVHYLEERAYPYHRAGQQRVDLAAGLEWLASAHDVDTVITDAGGELNAALLSAELVDEISVVVWPTLVGAGHTRLVSGLPEALQLELQSHATVNGGGLWLRYDLVR